MTPSAQTGIPFEQYAALDSVNWSSLKTLRDSPLAYRYHRDHRTDGDTTGRMKGRLLHSLVFEPETVGDTYAIFDGERRAGKEWEAFKLANADRTILKASELEEVSAQAEAVRSSPLLAPYLDGGVFELTCQWQDTASGLRCKSRPDWWHKSRRTLLDLKGTATIHEEQFGRIAARLGYVHQLAHYSNGIAAVAGYRPEKIAIVAVETKPPFDVGLFVLSEAMIEAASIEVAALLARLAECEASGSWPGRYTRETQLWEFNSEPSIAFEEEEQAP